MIVLPDGVIVPRPHGPRLPFSVAAKILESICGAPETSPEALPSYHWTQPLENLLLVAGYFVHSPGAHYDARMDALARGTNPEWLASDAVVALARQIADVNRIAVSGMPDLQRALGLRRLRIPLPHVDVVEWLVAELLARRRVRFQFADDWIYHINYGELHCGSNSIRRPPRDWPPIDPRAAATCLYDEATVAPPLPAGPVPFKNMENGFTIFEDDPRPRAWGLVMEEFLPKFSISEKRLPAAA